MADRDPLNTVDRSDVVHIVDSRPTNIMMGKTACGRLFTTPIYSPDWSALRWSMTIAHVTCLECVVT